MYNLNDIRVNDEHTTIQQHDFSCKGRSKNIEVYFKNIENVICKKIKESTNIFGCVAWLTNKKILEELSNEEHKSVLIIVQDEDFLRPDSYFDGNKQKFKKNILSYYDKLCQKDEIYLYSLGINTHGCVSSGIRRCGYINDNKLPAFPRMHNKFIILENGNGLYEVITGSFNYTENSTNSLENIVCIKDKKIVDAYFKQFGEIAIISMPLDWDKEWKPDMSDLRYGS